MHETAEKNLTVSEELLEVLRDQLGDDLGIEIVSYKPALQEHNTGLLGYERWYYWMLNVSVGGVTAPMAFSYGHHQNNPRDLAKGFGKLVNTAATRGLRYMGNESGRIRQMMKGHWKPVFGYRTRAQIDSLFANLSA